MADSPCMKNRSLKAGGRLNRWSLKAGFTVPRFTMNFGQISALLSLRIFLFSFAAPAMQTLSDEVRL